MDNLVVFSKLVHVVVLILTIIKQSSEADFYCDNNRLVGVVAKTSGSIITRVEGSDHYDNQLSCTWRIMSPSETGIVQISVASSVLQWAPKGANCVGYDYIQVFDGSEPTDPKILMWCGEENPDSIMSSDRWMLIKFISNDRNLKPFAGAKLDFYIHEQSSGLGQCPPGWFDRPESTNGGDTCYSLKTQPETWTNAQEHCNFDMSNLLSVGSESEENFIVDWIHNSGDVDEFDNVWISLNDIEVDGTYKWIDGTSPSFYSWDSDDHEPEAYYNCVQLNKNGKWEEDFCNENDIQSTVKHRYICEKKKVGKTKIYDIPSTRTDKGGKNTVSPERTWIILGSIMGVILLIIIIIVAIICVVRKKKSQKTWRQNSRDDPRVNQPMRENDRPAPTAPAYSEHDLTNMVAGAQPGRRGTEPTIISQGGGSQPTIVMVFPSSEPPPPYEETPNSNTTGM